MTVRGSNQTNGSSDYYYDDSGPVITSGLIATVLTEPQGPGIKSLIKCSLFRGFAVITGKPLYLWLENE